MEKEEIDRRFLERCINSWAHFIDKRLQYGKGRDDPVFFKNNINIVDQLTVFLEDWSRKGYSETESTKWADMLVKRANSGAESVEANMDRIEREDFFEIIKGRRSVRNFLKISVEEEKLKRLVEAALWAPSGCNMQPLDFIIVTTAEKMKWIAEVTGNQYLSLSPSLIIVIEDSRRTETSEEIFRPKKLRDKVRPVGEGNTGAAVQNILLAAHSLGLGTCWIGASRNKMEAKLARALGFPIFFVITAFIQVGYPTITPLPPPRRNIDECIHWLR